MSKSKIDDHLHWYKDAIIYELHIKAFMDANNDGIGDFKGLLSRLDYLEDLGVTAIWLLPFYPSPQRDDGYDIMDYYSINPAYGDIKDFKKFVKAAHKRNIKVITELVINHTSDQHPWFRRARKAPKGSIERDYYVWSDHPNRYDGVRIIFQDYESSNWTFDPVANQYYWHRFFHHQPDLNYDNPHVQQEVFKILEYWLKMGVDGFRLDAIPYLYQREGTNCENLPETHEYLKKLRSFVDTKYPGTLLLAEANMWPEDSASYFGDGDECQMNYHFPIMPRMFMSIRMEDRYPITDIFDQTPEIPETCQWGIFLRNHDELTLEMVTDEERDYMYKVYAQNPKARINLGLRRRLAPLMDNNVRKIELINSLLLSLPGTPILYYGDEIGMGDNFYLGDRNGVRTPMQWTPDRNAGFSKTNPQELYLPVILNPEYHFGTINVETQQNNPSSLLWWMKRMINIRKKHKAFSRGDMDFIQNENPKVLAFTRTYEEETLLIIVNLSRHTQAVELDLKDYSGSRPVEIFSKNEFPVISSRYDYPFTLGSFAYHWFVLTKDGSDQKLFPGLAFMQEKELLQDSHRKALEEKILPEYLYRSRWFDGKDRKLQELRINHYYEVPLERKMALLLIVEVHYATGLPDFYQIGMAFSSGKGTIPDKAPRSVINSAERSGVPGVLYDALYDDNFQVKLLQWMSENKRVKNGQNYMELTGQKSVRKFVKDTPHINARILKTRDTNTSLLFNQDYYLKLYRKLDNDINSDLEINRYLNLRKGFPNVPALKGNYQSYQGEQSLVLGLLQSAVNHQQEARSYFGDYLDRYLESILSLAELDEAVPTRPDYITPIEFKDIDDDIFTTHCPAIAVEQMRLLGERTAELHLYLGKPTELSNFKPEEFSLHYQRSLFSQYQTLVRKGFQRLERQLNKLPEQECKTAKDVLTKKSSLLTFLKKIHAEKLDGLKIRTHGDLHLDQVLFTGQDFVFIDFEGDPKKTYSQRRLKKSPLKDVSRMLRSIHHLTIEKIIVNENFNDEDVKRLKVAAYNWSNYMMQFFMTGYLSGLNGSNLVPSDFDQLRLMLEIFVTEITLEDLDHEFEGHPRKVLSAIETLGVQQV